MDMSDEEKERAKRFEENIAKRDAGVNAYGCTVCSCPGYVGVQDRCMRQSCKHTCEEHGVC